jgi:hypothetical protein
MSGGGFESGVLDSDAGSRNRVLLYVEIKGKNALVT